MTDRIEILAQQGAKLSVTLLLSAGDSLVGRAVRMQVRKFAGDTVVQLVASSTDERLLVTGDRQMQLEVPSGVMAALLVSEVVELWSYDIYSYSNTENAIREAEGVFRVSKTTTRDTEVEPAPTVAGFVSATIPQAWTAEQQQIGRINLGILDGSGGVVRSDGSIAPASIADSSAATNSLYYSTTAGKLVYKDGAGAVNALY